MISGCLASNANFLTEEIHIWHSVCLNTNALDCSYGIGGEVQGKTISVYATFNVRADICDPPQPPSIDHLSVLF